MRGRAVVTGGSRGIGAAIVKALVGAGYDVCFCHMGDDERAAGVIDDLRDTDAQLSQRSCDVSVKDQVDAFAAFALESLGEVDVLVNCAGIGKDQAFEDITPELWDQMIGVHLRGTFLITQAFYKGMLGRGRGKIINISSQLAYKGAPLAVPYCAAKAGMVGFTRSLALEAAPKGILVNCVAPGATETEMLMNASQEWRDEKVKALPAGRFGRPEDVAASVLFLASTGGDYYVGQTISPSGGDIML